MIRSKPKINTTDKVEYKVGLFRLSQNDIGRARLKFSHFVTDSFDLEKGWEECLYYHNHKCSPTTDFCLIRVINEEIVDVTRNGMSFYLMEDNNVKKLMDN